LSANKETTQVPTNPFKVPASHKHSFETKQPIMKRIHRVTMVLKLQSHSKSWEEQTTKICHSPPTAQEATMADKIL